VKTGTELQQQQQKQQLNNTSGKQIASGTQYALKCTQLSRANDLQ